MINSFFKFAGIAALVLFSTYSIAAENNLEQSLLLKIEKAQRHLAATEKRIASERHQLTTQLNTIEQNVVALREKTAVARRLTDEKTLSLSQLESRLDSWRQQQVYQQNLLSRFLQQHNGLQHKGRGDALPTRMNEQIAAVVDLSAQLEHRFAPSWQTADVVVDNGAVKSLPVLSIGPVNWYWHEQKHRAGLATDGDNGLQSQLLLSGGQSSGIEQLMTSGEGAVIFDPTLDRALTREQHKESVVEHIVKGGMWVIPILMFAMFALAIALLKVMQLWRLPKLVRFTPAVLQSLLKNPGRQIPITVTGMQKRLLDIALIKQPCASRDDQLFIQLQQDKTWLERWIGAIAVTASVSPLLGLLGTVSGMIVTFKMMTLFGAGDPEVVSGGIAQALVTTELGLVVAIPALIMNAILSRRAKSYYTELENFAVLIGQFDEQEYAVSTEEENIDNAAPGLEEEVEYQTTPPQGVPA